MRTHYPRTPHLPWSPGATSDDVRTTGIDGLAGREVVVTEKLDGENTTLYADGLHARSLDSGHHPSRAWVKALQSRIGPGIPADWRVCGENVYARHSLAYEELDSWFYGFSVWDGDHCLDWDRSVRFLHGLGVPGPRVLWRGVFDERALRRLRLDTTRQEGYVVRTVAGFERADFGRCVAKWVRGGHVRTDAHWMYARVVANGLGPAAPLWDVRSGADPDLAGLLEAVGAAETVPHGEPTAGAGAVAAAGAGAAGAAGTEGLVTGAERVVAEVADRIDGLAVRRTGEERLAGILAAALHGVPRARLAARLAAGPLGMSTARRVADLVGLYPALRRPFPYPDAERRAGLVRMAEAADLGVLHALAGAVPGPPDLSESPESSESSESVEWSALHAEEAGLLGPAPLEPLRTGLREALAAAGLTDSDAADRCWAQAREAYAQGKLTTPEEAAAATWRWRDGSSFPRLVQLCGPSGSGKSTYARALPGVETYISLDDLRTARGSRSDQRDNADVLREGLDRLDAALAAAARRGGTVVWDATSLTGQQRGLAGAVARRRDALVTHAVVLVEEAELLRRNSTRPHAVPAQVLASQLRRFAPPYPGEAHRTWYIGAGGAVEDTAGTITAATTATAHAATAWVSTSSSTATWTPTTAAMTAGEDG
ncbi:AAA family ATPase [Streptomyces sp. ISL-66]|uniref:RNA ligase family protein n=1 Tax=Streptomyces sp. ISL-66 TaxID=2819186 RepID=UPI001BEB911C|nr:RNA ligase family protein [Streptomyces sp. ISL-66]MBT2469884.1 AAA family ATPase [Streptomyces sp. ISL-66]